MPLFEQVLWKKANQDFAECNQRQLHVEESGLLTSYTDFAPHSRKDMRVAKTQAMREAAATRKQWKAIYTGKDIPHVPFGVRHGMDS